VHWSIEESFWGGSRTGTLALQFCQFDEKHVRAAIQGLDSPLERVDAVAGPVDLRGLFVEVEWRQKALD
jgi:hypothetical protein